MSEQTGTADYREQVKAEHFPASGSISFAVFNVGPYELRKAREEFVAEFGLEAFGKTIKPVLRKGIMTLFHEPPTQETAFYALAIARRVERRIAKAKGV